MHCQSRWGDNSYGLCCVHVRVHDHQIYNSAALLERDRQRHIAVVSFGVFSFGLHDRATSQRDFRRLNNYDFIPSLQIQSNKKKSEALLEEEHQLPPNLLPVGGASGRSMSQEFPKRSRYISCGVVFFSPNDRATSQPHYRTQCGQSGC